MSATLLTVLYQSLWNLASVFFMVWGYACGLDVIVGSFFFYFFHIVNLVIFHPQYIDSGYPLSTTPHSILYQSFQNFTYVFSIVWRCPCVFDIILALIFALFSTLWTLSFSDLRCLDSGYLVIATPCTILYWSFWNFAHVFSRVCKSACGLDRIFKFIFVTFSI